MRYIVIHKAKNGAEMHVLRNGNMSFYGTARKFLSRETAAEVAQEWAECLPRIVIRKVP
jgi:hypothetical protein